MTQATPEPAILDYPQRFQHIRADVEARLESVAPDLSGYAPRLKHAMRYSLLDGGKRLRPLVTVLTAEALGGRAESAIDTACAIEMVHTASLMIDDLPCMDNARTRRGKAASHIAHGEDITILAAISMISEAFGLIGSDTQLPAVVRTDLICVLSQAIGTEGLCAGQERDLRDISEHADENTLGKLQFQKTGALFVACLESGARIAGLDDQRLEPLRSFGTHAGLAFQILDDLLDARGEAAFTGKDRDADAGKQTFAAIMDPEEAESRAREELDSALAALGPADIDPAPFAAFLDLVTQAYRQQLDPNQLKHASAGG